MRAPVMVGHGCADFFPPFYHVLLGREFSEGVAAVWHG